MLFPLPPSYVKGAKHLADATEVGSRYPAGHVLTQLVDRGRAACQQHFKGFNWSVWVHP
jgi:hypothetical protein